MPTPESLRHLLRDLLRSSEVNTQPPEALLAVTEQAAEAQPTDRRLAEAMVELLRWCDAERGLAPSLGGVRRQRLIRWDAESTTWIGPGPDGGSWMVRALRPHADLPAQRRRWAREARALQPVLPQIRAEGPYLLTPAPGDPLEEAIEAPPERVARLLATGIASLHAWEQQGLGLPDPSPHELRALPDRLEWIGLTAGPISDAGPALRRLAEILETPAEPPSALAGTLQAFAAMPPRSASEAADALREALAQDLASRWHTLSSRARTTASARRHQRLALLVTRLQRAIPPPVGRGAVGVDLQGRLTSIHCDGQQIWWGPADDPQRVWSSEEGFDAPVARRLLRIRASGIPTRRMHEEVGGNEEQSEVLGRWIAAGLRLRTIQLLLDKAGPLAS